MNAFPQENRQRVTPAVSRPRPGSVLKLCRRRPIVLINPHRPLRCARLIGVFISGLALFGILTLASEPSDPHVAKRERMVRDQIADRGVTNRMVLDAMRRVPRHEFVASSDRAAAYGDHPLPIGHGQTISQPYIVGLMTELLALKPGEKVLEIGTGSGYQAAVLAEITTNVWTVEIVRPLYQEAKARLLKRKFDPESVRHGDGYFGVPEKAPFDAIIVTAAADHIPPPLLRQLKPGGRMIIPIGPVHLTQRLVLVEKDTNGKVRTRTVLPVMFVPLTGGPGKSERPDE